MSGKIIAMSDMKNLASFLKAKEERAWMQRFMTGSSGIGGFVVQISLNIPGWPKRLNGDRLALEAGEAALLCALGFRPAARILLYSAAGFALMMVFPDGERSARNAKKISVGIEEASEWGRVLDIDVITAGAHISRADIGLDPRKCLLCGSEAKVCARMGTHVMDELRRVTSRLISSAR